MTDGEKVYRIEGRKLATYVVVKRTTKTLVVKGGAWGWTRHARGPEIGSYYSTEKAAWEAYRTTIIEHIMALKDQLRNSRTQLGMVKSEIRRLT